MELSKSVRRDPYFGLSPEIETAKRYINAAASEHCAVLLLGESGTGKGVAAQWIHSHSPRKDCAFVDINCSGLKGELLKSELFGHARGAFTGAINDREGLIEEANGGTLFLDEIGDMDINVQCQLLKALEEKTFRRVGENRQRSSDFRLICATSRNLQEAMGDRAFREDFFYRVSTLTISLPPLRTHREDIPELVNHILTRMGYDCFPVSDSIVEMLTRRQWRGNIRELRNTLERALIFAHGEILSPEHFSGAAENAFPAQEETRAPMPGAWDLKTFEDTHIRRVLKRFGGDKRKTSEALGIPISSLYRKLDRMWERGGKNKNSNAVKQQV